MVLCLPFWGDLTSTFIMSLMCTDRTLPQPSLIRLKRILTNSVAQKRNSNGFRFFWSCTRNLMKYITHNFRLQTESQVRETRCLNTFGRVASEVFWWKQKQQLAALNSCSCALFVWWVDRGQKCCRSPMWCSCNRIVGCTSSIQHMEFCFRVLYFLNFIKKGKTKRLSGNYVIQGVGHWLREFSVFKSSQYVNTPNSSWLFPVSLHIPSAHITHSLAS